MTQKERFLVSASLSRELLQDADPALLALMTDDVQAAITDAQARLWKETP